MKTINFKFGIMIKKYSDTFFVFFFPFFYIFKIIQLLIKNKKKKKKYRLSIVEIRCRSRL